MKEHWKMFKRSVAALLAVVMVLSCAPVNVFATEDEHDPHVSLGVLIKQNVDGLSDEEAAIITSGALDADQTYHYQMPGDADDLISVNEETGTVTAKVYTDPEHGTVWVPKSFTLTDGQSAIAGYKDLALTEDGDQYVGTYEMEETNPGNSFSVEVTYSLELTISDEDMTAQQEMLDAPYQLAQDIATLKYLNAVGVIGDDQELADQIVKLSGGLIKDPSKIYANTILEFMGMNLEQLGNQSAIDMIYQLVEGISVPVVDEVDWETGEMTMGEYFLQLDSNAGKEAITNLFNQKNGDGLALVEFLEDHYNTSYLEMLVKYGDELKAALFSNYEDIDYLATNRNALRLVSKDIQDLLNEFTALRLDAYDAINEKLESQGYDAVNSVKELQKVIAELEAADEEAYALIDEALKELDDTTKQQLEDMGITLPEQVTNADELNQLKEAVVGAYTDALTKVNETLADLDQDTKDQLKAKGAPESITIADTSSYEAFVNAGDQDLADLTALENALIAVREDAMTEANAELQKIYTDYADWKDDLLAAGAPEKIETAEDLSKLQTALTTFKADMLAEADDLLQDIYTSNAEMETKLQAEGAPAKIETAEDLTKLQTALTAVKAELLETADEKLQEIYENPDYAELKSRLQDKDVPTKIETTEDLTKLQDALTAVKAELLEAANDELEAIYEDPDYADLKSQLQAKGAPDEIKTTKDLKDLQAALSSVKTSLLNAGKELQDGLYSNTTLRSKLISKGAKTTITKSADVTALKNALIAVYADTLTEANTQYEAVIRRSPTLEANLGISKIESKEDIETLLFKFENELSSALQNMVAGTKASLETALAALEGMETAIEVVTPLEAAILAVEEVETVLNTAVTAVDALDAVQANLTTAIDGIGTLETAQADLDTAIAGVTKLDEAVATLNTAIDAVDLLNEVLGILGQVKSAVTSVKPYIAKVLEAQELIALLNGTYLPLAKKVAEGLTQLETGIADMEAKKQQFDTLIMVMQVFCETVKPVYDAFENNTWKAPQLIDTTASPNYADLTAKADGLTQSNHVAVNPLHVTETVVHYQVDMFNVTVEFKAKVVNPAKVDSVETIDLTTKTYTLTLKKNTTAAEILAELALEADENEILSGWAISANNYDRSTSALPELLTEDITYTISYAPKTLNVTFGEGYEDGTPAMQVPYGYRMTLPKLEGDAKNEYTYKVNDQVNLDQGTVVTITEDTAISREIGAISAKQYLTDLVVNTDPDMNVLVKNILQNQALNKGNAISIRVPGKDQVVVTPSVQSTTITALPYPSRVGDKSWIAKTAVIDGVTVNLVDGVHVEDENPGFDAVVVNYELAITAAALGITDEQLLAVINTPYELVTDYKYQQNTIDTLASDEIMGLLAMLNDTDVVFQDFTLRNALGKIDLLEGLLEITITQRAKDAAAKLFAMIPEGGGYVPLYYTLKAYKEQGMLHYYRNEQTYIAQITELNDLLTDFTSDPAIMGHDMLKDKLTMLTSIQEVLATAASLAEPEHRVNTELINVGSPYLSTLVNALEAAKAVELEEKLTAPGELVWMATVEQPGPSKRIAEMFVDFNCAQKTATKNVGFGETLVYADLIAWAKELAAELGLTDEIAVYYNVSYSFSGDVVADQNVALSAAWTLREYPVYIGSDLIGNVNYEDRQITLAQHADPNYQYRYYINGELTAAGTHTLTLAQFKSLTKGELTITRETVNLTEASLIKLIDGMNGAAVLTKDANGQYAIVLRVDPATLEDDMGNFAIGLFMTDYKYIGLNGSTFFDGKFHIQALVDAIMDSGLGTESLLNLIDENGNITSNLDLGNVEVLNTVKPAYLNKLGGVLLETSMGLGADAQNTTNAKFYITLAGGSTDLISIRSGLQNAKDMGITLICQDGQVNVTATLPDQAYGAYLAVLAMAGKADLHNVNDINAEAAIGYLLDLLKPALKDDEITIEVITNTLAMAGVAVDLGEYGKYYDVVKNYINLNDVTYNGDTAYLAIENASVNSLIGKLQGTIDKMELPAGMTLNLANLIYEYDDPNTTEDDATAGLDIAANAKLTNLNTNYAALVLDIEAADMMQKFDLWKEEELVAGTKVFAGTSAIILLDDVAGDLNISSTTTVLDLNGKTVTGNIYGNKSANLVIVDSAYKADTHGTVNGTVSGNVTVLDGKFTDNVTPFLNDGYAQDENGVVSNKLFTVIVDENNNHTVVLNVTPEDIKGLATEENLTDLAIEIAVSLLVNNLDTSSLSIEGNKILNVQLDDALSLYFSENKLDTIIDEGLNWIAVPALNVVINMIIDDLTDFAALESALLSDGKIASYDIITTPWEFQLVKSEQGDHLTANVGASENTKESSLNIVVAGSLQDELAQLAGAMKDTVAVDVTVEIEELIKNNAVINANASVTGTIEVDFTENPNYVIAMAVILADRANSTVKAELVAAIEVYYETSDLYQLEKVFKTLTAKQLCDSIRKHGLDKQFDSMVNGLALKAETKAAILANITNDELGYSYAVDVAGFALRQLKARAELTSITDSSRTLGSFEKSDENGKYFGIEQGRVVIGEYTVYAPYKLGYKLDATNVSVKLRMFTDHVHNFKQIVDEEYLVTGATCTELAVYKMSCSTCGEAHPTETFTYGELLEHKFTKEVVDDAYLASGATCTQQATYYYLCSECDAVSDSLTFAYGELANHQYAEVVKPEYLVSGATYTQKAVYKKSCSVCGEAHPTETFQYGDVKPCPAPEVEITDVKVDSGIIYGWDVVDDGQNALLMLDIQPNGITQAELEEILKLGMENDTDNTAKLTVSNYVSYKERNLIPNGATVTLEVENIQGTKTTKTYAIVILGDANCNGRTDSGDATMMMNHFYGTNKLSGLALVAADNNQNGKIEAGDARKNQVKFLEGSTADAIRYVSALTK